MSSNTRESVTTMSPEARAKSQARRLRTYPGVYLRMPLGFGPFPGPCQTEIGLPQSGWSSVEVTTATVTFKASKAHLSTFLPHGCFSIDSHEETCFASLAHTSLDNFSWLGGRGYNHFGLYIHDAVCKGKNESVRGKYLVVLFENRADPITSGREELGYAKLYCSLKEDLDLQKYRYRLDAGWEGASFGRMLFEGLKEAVDTPGPRTSSGPSEGLLLFKYVPATGRPGYCDVQYPTFSSSAAEGISVVEKVWVANSASFEFHIDDAAKLPTLSHVVAGLGEIEPLEIVDTRVVISKGQSDLRDQRAISI